MTGSPVQRTDLQLDLHDINFEVDRDEELCIEIFEGHGVAREWLTRAQGQQLLDLLTRWLS